MVIHKTSTSGKEWKPQKIPHVFLGLMVPYLKQTPIVGNRTIYFPGELVNLFYEETYSPYQVVDMADQVGFVRCCVRPL